MKTVTDVLNKAHLSSNSTLGAPREIGIYGEPLTPSLNFSTAYAFKTIDDLGAYHEDKFDSVRYSRDSSVLVRQLEHYFEMMHGGSSTLLFNSGMAAISACLNALVNKKTTIVSFGEFYRKTLSIFEQYENRFDIHHYNFETPEDHTLKDPGSYDLVVLLESPSNPFLRLVDVGLVRELFPNATIILDITFQGLLNSKTELQGVDLAISSCTKYIGGHNDVMGGIVSCKNEALYSLLWDERSMKGGIIDNLGAYLLIRSLRTYDLRIRETIKNTLIVLEFLEKQTNVSEIFYPGRYANDHEKALFDKEHYHGGGVVTFRVNKLVDLVSNLKELCSTKMAPSFGSVDSLVEIPMFMSHWGKKPEDLLTLGLDSHTVRFSVGNEPANYILGDLERMLHVD